MKPVIRTKAAAALLAGALLCGGAAACSDDTSGGKGKSGSSQNGGGSNKADNMSPAAAVEKAVKNNEDITSLSFAIKGSTPDGPVEGQAAMDIEKPALQMKLKGGKGAEAGEVEIRMVDKAMYMKAEGQGSDGKEWLKFDLAALGEGEDPLSELSGAGQDPTGEVSGIKAAKDLKKVGEEKVDGVDTTHYTGTVTLDQLREELKKEDADTREKREKSLDEYEKLGADKLTMDIWIDGEDRTKQFRTRSSTDKGPMDITITFGEVNQPVTVEAPPAAKVLDMADLNES